MSHPGVTVIILHPEAPLDAEPLVRAVASARAGLAERHRHGFLAAGAVEARIVAGPPDDRSFGSRLRELAAGLPDGDGLVVLGSGAIPLATRADRARFVAAAAGGPGGRALANNRYSADVVAIPDARTSLAAIPELPTDNALPRWLEEVAGVGVDDLAGSWRLAMDVDTALDLVLLGGRSARAIGARDRERVNGRLAALRDVVADPGAELVIAGRTSPATLTWVTRATASRTRALVEERGLRTGTPGQRHPASVLGLLLERDGPAALGDHLARLGEAAVIDSRVLLAHRHGADQRAWPSDADRFASDLLLHERVDDPWLRELTRSAAEAAIPVLLGAHYSSDPDFASRCARAGRIADLMDRPEPARLDVRRHELPDPSDAGEDAALVTRIRDEIAAHGPMPFARFMDLALYDPDGGYYRAAEARPGRGGDFVTAPELHPIFGATLASAVLETWKRLGRPDPFVVIEHGAGEGALAVPLLRELSTTPAAGALRYHPFDIDQRRTATLTERLDAAGLAHLLMRGEPVGVDGLVLGNEILDALPVHRVRRRGDRLVEIAVALDDAGSLAETEIEPTTDALAARLAAEGIELADGQTAEICLALDAWLAAAAGPLARGLVLLIDYGYLASDLYDPIRRRDGTLRAYVRQAVHGDPYRHVGRQDLTAHVDVTAVERAAHAAGLTTVGITTQAEALMGLGIERRLQAIQTDPATTMEAYREVRSALMRFLDPAAMGRFRVMAFGRDWPASDGDTPIGLFAFRLPERTRRPG